MTWSVYYHMASLSIIRVKRKLPDESPAEALLVTAKRRRTSQESDSENGPSCDQQLVYVYAGSTSREAEVRETVDFAHKRHLLYKSRGIRTGGEKIERYLTQRTDIVNQETTSRSVFLARKRKLHDNLEVFDATERLANQGDNPNTAEADKGVPEPPKPSEDVTCNGLSMLREKLKSARLDTSPGMTSSCQPPQVYTSDGDDCFDLYYRDMGESENGEHTCHALDAAAGGAGGGDAGPGALDIMYMVPYTSQDLAGCLSEEEEANNDDSDDSNDENNWRNDYPEDSASSDEDGQPRYNGTSFTRFGEMDEDPTDFFDRYSEFVQSGDSDSIGSD